MEYQFYVLGFLGVVIHVLKKMYEARKNHVKLDMILELLSTVISLIITVALIYSSKDLESLYPITMLTALILGYSAQSVFRFLANAASPKTNKFKAGEGPDPDKEEK